MMNRKSISERKEDEEMKNRLNISSVQNFGETLLFDFKAEGPWQRFFRAGNDFYVRNNIDISDVPSSVSIIPFLGNLLPLAWICDAEVVVPEVDEDFFQSLPAIQRVYGQYYPALSFDGSLTTDRIVRNKSHENDGVGLFFSGGLDSVSSLWELEGKKPVLLTLWGSDIKLLDHEGWRIVRNHVERFSQHGGFSRVTIESSFREFINEEAIDEYIRRQVDVGWWFGFQFGLGIISHGAPIAWKRNLSTLYFSGAGSWLDPKYQDEAKNAKLRSAGTSQMVETPKFCGVKIVCAQSDWKRQRKIEFAAPRSLDRTDAGNDLSWRVCWRSDGGSNCCHCEKCFRTIYGLIAAGYDPVRFGFPAERTRLSEAKKLWDTSSFNFETRCLWKDIQEAFSQWDGTSIPKETEWILRYDFGPLSLNKKIVREIKRPFKKWRRKIVRHQEKKRLIAKTKEFFNQDRRILYTGVPDYTNLGDQAIAIATRLFLEKIAPDFDVLEMTDQQFGRVKKRLPSLILRDTPVILQGGGHMGINWFEAGEKPRREILQTLTDRPMILFPQTIDYGDSPEGREQLEISKPIYCSCSRLTITAREKFSFDIMKEAYPDVKVILVPDIALTLPRFRSDATRRGLMFCMRTDKERTFGAWKTRCLLELCENFASDFKFTSMIAAEDFPPSERVHWVDHKLKEFSQAELVITDRLHGMLFAVVTETPCVVLESATHKTKGVFDWVKNLGYISYANSVEEAAHETERLLGKTDCHYDPHDFLPAFAPLKEALEQAFSCSD